MVAVRRRSWRAVVMIVGRVVVVVKGVVVMAVRRVVGTRQHRQQVKCQHMMCWHSLEDAV